MKPVSRLIGLLILALLVMGSGRFDLDRRTADQDAVRIVHNRSPRWGDDPKVALQFVQKIGQLDTEDDNYLLYRPADVIRAEDGTIYVLDNGNNRIQAFDAEGRYLRTLGRQGQGPREVESPFSMDLSEQGALHVCDLGNQRIQVFSTDGDPIRSIRMGVGDGKRFTAFRMTSSGEYVARTAPIMYPNEDPSEVALLNVFDGECFPAREIGVGLMEDRGDWLNTVFLSVHTYDLDRHDNIVISYSFLNRIEKFSADGILLFRADRPLTVDVNLTPADPEELVLISNAVAVDAMDRIWVSTLTRVPTQEEMESEEDAEEPLSILEVFDGDGSLLARMPKPAMAYRPPLTPIATPAGSLMRIYGDRLFLVDMLEEMCVYEYRIVELD